MNDTLQSIRGGVHMIGVALSVMSCIIDTLTLQGTRINNCPRYA